MRRGVERTQLYRRLTGIVGVTLGALLLGGAAAATGHATPPPPGPATSVEPGQVVSPGLPADAVQLVLEGRPQVAVREVLDFCTAVGLPVCLADLGLPAPARSEIRQVAEAAVAPGETIHATWFPVDAAMVEAAIWAADAIGSEHRRSVAGGMGPAADSACRR